MSEPTWMPNEDEIYDTVRVRFDDLDVVGIRRLLLIAGLKAQREEAARSKLRGVEIDIPRIMQLDAAIAAAQEGRTGS